MDWIDVTSYPAIVGEHPPKTYEVKLGKYRFGISRAPDLNDSWTGYAFGPYVAARRVNLETKDAEKAKSLWLAMLLDHFQELTALLAKGN